MFALEHSDANPNDLRILNDAIDELCNVLGEDREELIQRLTDIIQRRVKFELMRPTTYDEPSY